MAALHIVGVDFEFRSRIDLGGGREQQVAARLSRIDFLRVLTHDDLAAIDAAATAVCDTAVLFIAQRVRSDVVNQRVRVQMLRAVGREQTAQVRLCTRALAGLP